MAENLFKPFSSHFQHPGQLLKAETGQKLGNPHHFFFHWAHIEQRSVTLCRTLQGRRVLQQRKPSQTFLSPTPTQRLTWCNIAGFHMLRNAVTAAGMVKKSSRFSHVKDGSFLVFKWNYEWIEQNRTQFLMTGWPSFLATMFSLITFLTLFVNENFSNSWNCFIRHQILLHVKALGCVINILVHFLIVSLCFSSDFCQLCFIELKWMLSKC